MSAEVSFTKRAAAELSRCFNSLSVSKISSNKKSAGTGPSTSSSTSSSASSSSSSTTSTNTSSTASSSTSTVSSFKVHTLSSIISKDKEPNHKVSKVQNKSSIYSEKSSKNLPSINTNLDNNSRKQSVDHYHATHSRPNLQFTGIKNYFEEALMNKSNSLNRFGYNQARKPPPPKAPPKTTRARQINYLLNLRKPKTTNEMWKDAKFLSNFFLYFTSKERCLLAQICTQWHDILYSQPLYWKGLLLVIYYNELRRTNEDSNGSKAFPSIMIKFGLNNTPSLICDPFKSDACDTFKSCPISIRSAIYSSLEKRGFDSVCLYGATDADIFDFASKMSPSALSVITFGSLRCSCLTDQGLEIFLAALNQSIEKLELSGCNEISDSGMWTSLIPRLESLTITDCINIADETVAAITQLLPALKELTLQAYHVTDTSMAYFGRTSSRETIKKLHLLHCWELSNQGILNIAHSLPHLQSLSLSGCSKITDDSMEVIAEQLRELTRLDLSWCARISDSALEYIACDLSDTLQELILDRCQHISDIGLGYIATMGHLTSLSLRWCTQITDFGLQTLCSMKSLKTLSLAGCPQFSINGLSCLVQMQQLADLELTNCPVASKELLDYLKDNLSINCNIII